MKLHILVEGVSEKAFLDRWLPRFIPQHVFNIIPHRGKGKLPLRNTLSPESHRQGLLDQLPFKLRAFGKAFNSATDRVLVLVDQDDDCCRELKRRMLQALEQCDPKPVVMFRIATRMTEAFYLGEPGAIKQAYPRADMARLLPYRSDGDPETGDWKTFADIIGEAQENKVAWAEVMAENLAWDRPLKRNRSTCFRHFCRAVLQLCGEVVEE